MNQTKQDRLQKMAMNLHYAELGISDVQDYLRSAREQMEALMTTQEFPIDKTTLDTDRALSEIATFASWVEVAFEKPMIQTILKAYRCGKAVAKADGGERKNTEVGK